MLQKLNKSLSLNSNELSSCFCNFLGADKDTYFRSNEINLLSFSKNIQPLLLKVASEYLVSKNEPELKNQYIILN
jgi:hypothetical protein